MNKIPLETPAENSCKTPAEFLEGTLVEIPGITTA